ncbi:hypothetical protein [Sinorhizobium sp. BG8]|uniref:hypothetical protein n=1 Tax=Sinorhizobium sp. BG8 TaxID=2613773 RepID=UPI001AFADE64|nr:hypothetical protein [Sinorhizobium sp. BG8]QRM56790.1 hypothetical protein F3Y30_04290 [Sinorhizobium sp. BG8]
MGGTDDCHQKGFFKPDKLPAHGTASPIDTTAKNIVAAETAARDKKTQKLRALRLAQPNAEAKPRSE